MALCIPPVRTTNSSFAILKSATPTSIAASIELDAEYSTICNTFAGFLPSEYIFEIQDALRYIGVEPSAKEDMILTFIIPAVLLAIVAIIIGLCRKHMKILIFLALILGLIYYVRYVNPSTAIKEAFTSSPAPAREGFQLATAPPSGDQYTLINIQPAAIKQLAYVGPTVLNGGFNPSAGIINAMTAGVRFLTLQIDYLESPKDSKKFDDVGVPTLLYRNNAGNIISSNGASISDIAKNIATYAFNPQFATSVQPIILYLHFVRTPDYLTAPDKYIKFLSATATALAPIRSLLIPDNGNTLFSRQQNEKILLYTPLQTFEGQIIVLSNVDTSIFRNAAQLGLPVVPLSQDLDSVVAMRVYLDDEGDQLGATTIVGDTIARAVIVPYSRLKGMTVSQRKAFAQKGKGRFAIAMPDQLSDPSQADIADLLTTTGVNVVPTNLLGLTIQDVAGTLTTWGTTPFYNLKPLLLQSAQIATSGYSGQALGPPIK